MYHSTGLKGTSGLKVILFGNYVNKSMEKRVLIGIYYYFIFFLPVYNLTYYEGHCKNTLAFVIVDRFLL